MDAAPVKIAFERQIVVLPVQAILPLRQISETTKNASKYRRIARSIAEIGIIEPLVVAPDPEEKKRYLLLDGHIRLQVLIGRGDKTARCLISHDDEAFTYNKRVNRLATIQEHYMIVRALERGVSEEKLAKALDLNIRAIRRRRVMLDGICTEAIELLKDKAIPTETFDVLRKMKPMRQIEVAELMLSVANYSKSYAKVLLAATKRADLVKADRPKEVGGITADQIARMEREMESLEKDFRAVEARYGDDVLNLVIASGYVSKLISNPKVARYLGQHHPEILEEFRAIVSAVSLDQTSASRSV